MPIPVLDLLHARWCEKRGGLMRSAPFERRRIRWDDRPIAWFVFLGIGQSVDAALALSLVPREGTAIVHTFPTDELFAADPAVCRRNFERQALEVLASLEEIDASVEIRVASFSAGNSFGYFVANRSDRVRKFVSVVTGSGMGEEMFASRGCGPAADRAKALGYSGARYDEALAGLLPRDNADRLPADTSIYLGLADAYVPPRFGAGLARRVRATNPRARVRYFPLGHLGTVAAVGGMFRARIEPTAYGEGGFARRLHRGFSYAGLRFACCDAPRLLGIAAKDFFRKKRFR